MENRRFILIALMGVVLFFIYQAWQDEQALRAPPAPPTPQATVEAPDSDSNLPRASLPEGSSPMVSPAAATAVSGAIVSVQTDVYRVEIALDGAGLSKLELIGYPVTKDRPEEDVALLNEADAYYFVLQTGLAGSDRPLASHLQVFSAPQNAYVLANGQDELRVPLEYVDASGYRVVKTYVFRRGSYEIELEQQIENHSGRNLTVSPYARFVRTPVAVGKDPRFVHTFLGVGFYEQKDDTDKYKFRKIKFDKLEDEPVDRRQLGGWITMLQHYFAAGILPPGDEHNTFSARPARDRGYIAQYVGPGVDVANDASGSFSTRFYIGPKLQKSIDKVAPGFELTVDYGILTAVAEPLFWVLAKFHQYTGNWGWSIVLLTLLVKALFYKLSEAQYRSMAKMRKFAPRMAEIKERYADDRERASKAMMELYKKEGFNPMASCLPMLVQFPVFISLYWVFLESVELRQAGWILWLNDLSSPDPFYVLPVLYGATMFVMQRLSGQNAAMDPMQQRIMSVMPIALTGFFAFFPAGLVLYWVVSNAIGIAQQWYITRKLDREGLGRAK